MPAATDTKENPSREAPVSFGLHPSPSNSFPNENLLTTLKHILDDGFADLMKCWKRDRLRAKLRTNIVDAYYLIRLDTLNNLAFRANTVLRPESERLRLFDPAAVQQSIATDLANRRAPNAPHSRRTKLLDTPPLAGKRP